MEKIVTVLKKRYPKKSVSEIRAVAADLHYSGEGEILADNPKVVERLFEKWSERKKAEAEPRYGSETAVDVCPICKVGLKPIKLDGDRDAIFCSKHFVVLPLKSKQDEKEEKAEATASAAVIGRRGVTVATYVSPFGAFGEINGQTITRYALFTDIRVCEGWPKVVWAQLETSDGEIIEDVPSRILPPSIREKIGVGARFNLPQKLMEDLLAKEEE